MFDRADRSGDVIRPGAFAGAGLPRAAAVPLLWQHDAARPAGTIERIEEDGQGLRVVGRAAGVARGMGLSFGYRVRQAREGTNRQLLKLDLVEVSLVRVPMQPLARVLAVEAHRDSAAVPETPRPGQPRPAED